MGHQNMEALLKRYLMAGYNKCYRCRATYNFLKLRDSLSGKQIIAISLYDRTFALLHTSLLVFMGA